MIDIADVVVVGGGACGASTAFHLARLGAGRVVLLERAYFASGATGKSGAVVRMHYTNPYDATLAQKSLPYFQHWQDLVGPGVPGFVQTGVVRLVDAGQEDVLAANVEMLRSVGVNTWLISREELLALDPAIAADDVAVAAYEPEGGYADPVATTLGFALRAQQLGAELRLGTPATGIRIEAGRVTGVTTPDGTISAGAVVLAAGAWANRLLSPLGLDFGLKPNRVQVAIFRRLEERPRIHPVVIDGPHAMWIRPEGSWSTLAGFDLDQFDVDPDTYDEGVDPTYVTEVRRRLVQRLPTLATAPMRGGWSGVIMSSPDGHAIIDQVPSWPGLFVILGDSGTNFKTAPAIGACIAEWIVHGEPDTADIRPFRSTRFAEGAPVRGQHEYGSDHVSVFR